MQRVIGVTGWKNSGKTTLVERLVRELTARGYRVSTVKHAHHSFDVDHEGTDSFRHRSAGAGEVAIVSQARLALIRELGNAEEPTLDAVLAMMAPCDLVIVEGYKREPIVKIEIRRREARDTAPLCAGDPLVAAIVSDAPVAETHLPAFGIDDIEAVADFVERATGLG